MVRSIVGANWGDEGKGKITDLLAEELLDSLAFIELLEGLEDLGIILQPTRIPKDRFRTVDSILALVREYAG